MSPDLVNFTISTNLNGAFFAVQAAAQQMAKQEPQGGSIIGISSISALVGGGQQGHYTPTKAGVLSLMQSSAVALGKYGIRCNALLPGTILTQLNERDLEAGGDKRKYMDGRCALGRVGVPEVSLSCVESEAVRVDVGANPNAFFSDVGHGRPGCISGLSGVERLRGQ